ncbi:MAG: inositol monophosphatase, partial [Gammaproteobacteria bacterium]|nr:inositol monophosphatase [Gammaproteobacteria bacterium]
MHPMLNIGIRAARAAGDHIVRYMDRIEGMSITSKGRNDFVTEVDKQAELIIIDIIHKAY